MTGSRASGMQSCNDTAVSEFEKSKVGKVYSEDTTIEQVASREVSRLSRSIEHKLILQNATT